jgi:hypothetical protein
MSGYHPPHYMPTGMAPTMGDAQGEHRYHGNGYMAVGRYPATTATTTTTTTHPTFAYNTSQYPGAYHAQHRYEQMGGSDHVSRLNTIPTINHPASVSSEAFPRQEDDRNRLLHHSGMSTPDFRQMPGQHHGQTQVVSSFEREITYSFSTIDAGLNHADASGRRAATSLAPPQHTALNMRRSLDDRNARPLAATTQPKPMIEPPMELPVDVLLQYVRTEDGKIRTPMPTPSTAPASPTARAPTQLHQRGPFPKCKSFI